MSEEKNHILLYSAEDIDAYFSGKLSPVQMHSIEKAALDDPFLAEAMEGFGMSKGINWKPQLEALRQHFANSASAAKVVVMRRTTVKWWRIAAAVLVLGIGATMTYVLTKKNSDSVSPAAGKEVAKQVPPQQVPSTNYTVDPKQTSPVIKEEHPIAVVRQATKGITNKYFVPANTTKDIVSNGTLKTNIPESPTYENIRKDEVKSAPAPAVNNNASAMKHVFVAQVVGPDNTPLPFSNISVKSENFGTYADVKGGFRLVSADSLINIEVRSVGYQPRTYSLRSDVAQNTIMLSEDASTAMERAVVKNDDQGSSKILRRAMVLRDSAYVNVEPADGWENYNAYVANNLAIPQDAVKKDLHGEVEISFKVHPNGAITDITVDKSNCADCSELAKRLVEQGPQWKIKRGIHKSSGKIKMTF